MGTSLLICNSSKNEPINTGTFGTARSVATSEKLGTLIFDCVNFGGHQSVGMRIVSVR
jgi:hypothetical protein